MKKDNKYIEIMEAYNVKYKTKVRIIDESVIVPPGALSVNQNDVVTIFKVDGMYCNGINANNERIYIAAWTNVEII
jgi:hypothetical protein